MQYEHLILFACIFAYALTAIISIVQIIRLKHANALFKSSKSKLQLTSAIHLLILFHSLFQCIGLILLSFSTLMNSGFIQSILIVSFLGLPTIFRFWSYFIVIYTCALVVFIMLYFILFYTLFTSNVSSFYFFLIVGLTYFIAIKY